MDTTKQRKDSPTTVDDFRDPVGYIHTSNWRDRLAGMGFKQVPSTLGYDYRKSLSRRFGSMHLVATVDEDYLLAESMYFEVTHSDGMEMTPLCTVSCPTSLAAPMARALLPIVRSFRRYTKPSHRVTEAMSNTARLVLASWKRLLVTT